MTFRSRRAVPPGVSPADLALYRAIVGDARPVKARRLSRWAATVFAAIRRRTERRLREALQRLGFPFRR